MGDSLWFLPAASAVAILAPGFAEVASQVSAERYEFVPALGVNAAGSEVFQIYVLDQETGLISLAGERLASAENEETISIVIDKENRISIRSIKGQDDQVDGAGLNIRSVRGLFVYLEELKQIGIGTALSNADFKPASEFGNSGRQAVDKVWLEVESK